MAYVRTNWEDDSTALSADNMNNIEDGIEENKEKINLIGTYYVETATPENPIVVTAGGYATVCTLESLQAGTYILTGHLRWNSIQTGRISIGVGLGQFPGGNVDGVNGTYVPTSNLPNLALQTSVIIELNEAANIYLTGYADHESTISHGTLKAIRIK